MKISCARNLAAMLLASFALAGCFDESTPTAASDPTHSVEWFKAHEAERDATLQRCWNNPGELAETPNCVNAEQASKKNDTGSLRKLDNIEPLSFGKNRSDAGE
ncbi:EexN family lipoprotein [Vibrio sp. 665]|uniref:EexN family lipoprotein n=1 Tax=Gammaproteobacteria TaxID=1236 RepID=UPI002964C047|nr:EexN family lipoprotein [Vibrio sp. 665]MDW2034946.1 EexN family lipoprotein [Vibrio sp. 665]